MTADSAQPLMNHLVELRSRLLWVCGIFALATVGCYFFASAIYGFLTEPLAEINTVVPRRLIYTGLTEAFTTYLKVALFSGLFATVPFILWQAWRFVAPGLYNRERRAIAPFFIMAPVLFILGAGL